MGLIYSEIQGMSLSFILFQNLTEIECFLLGVLVEPGVGEHVVDGGALLGDLLESSLDEADQVGREPLGEANFLLRRGVAVRRSLRS